MVLENLNEWRMGIDLVPAKPLGGIRSKRSRQNVRTPPFMICASQWKVLKVTGSKDASIL